MFEPELWHYHTLYNLQKHEYPQKYTQDLTIDKYTLCCQALIFGTLVNILPPHPSIDKELDMHQVILWVHVDAALGVVPKKIVGHSHCPTTDGQLHDRQPLPDYVQVVFSREHFVIVQREGQKQKGEFTVAKK